MQFTLAIISAIAALASTAFASPIEARSDAVYTITVQNSCGMTVWPGVGQSSDSPGKVSEDAGGFELAPGASRTISVPVNWIAGRIFGRTGCSWSDSHFFCETGDCGGLSCAYNTGMQGVTLAEFSYSDTSKTFYNISLISGYNLGMKITPSDGSCPAFDCPFGTCSDSQAYLPGSSANPCAACSLSAAFVVEFCPS